MIEDNVTLPPEVAHLQKLDVKSLWIDNYYDGPLSGVCEVAGERCWFEILAETDGARCAKDEECSKKIQAEIESGGGKIPSRPVADEEWGCPPGQESCWAIPGRRYYGVYRVDPETMAEESRRHALFRKHVGRHWDCVDDGVEHEPPTGQTDLFYKEVESLPELNMTQELIGYFSW